jgi:hypothetical protein
MKKACSNCNLIKRGSYLAFVPVKRYDRIINIVLIFNVSEFRGSSLKPLLLTILTSLLSLCSYQEDKRAKPGNLLTKRCSFSFPHNKMSLTFCWTFHFHLPFYSTFYLSLPKSRQLVLLRTSCYNFSY